MSEPTTAAGRELLVTIQDEHCRLDDNGCHSADEHFVSEGVPAIESEAYAQGVREERKRLARHQPTIKTDAIGGWLFCRGCGWNKDDDQDDDWWSHLI